MSAELVELYASNLRDPVATLRVIADAIEAGEYGTVGTCALVLLGEKMHVFAMGSESDAPAAALLMQAAIMRLAGAVEKHGR